VAVGKGVGVGQRLGTSSVPRETIAVASDAASVVVEAGERDGTGVASGAAGVSVLAGIARPHAANRTARASNAVNAERLLPLTIVGFFIVRLLVPGIVDVQGDGEAVASPSHSETGQT